MMCKTASIRLHELRRKHGTLKNALKNKKLLTTPLGCGVIYC